MFIPRAMGPSDWPKQAAQASTGCGNNAAPASAPNAKPRRAQGQLPLPFPFLFRCQRQFIDN